VWMTNHEEHCPTGARCIDNIDANNTITCAATSMLWDGVFMLDCNPVQGGIIYGQPMCSSLIRIER